ncbi:MAG: CDP-diacylglycerol--glycerol-3-phosphate 3-phosphatidyltransferase [Zetaproteobacteria bacterium CG2_30_46_52]|nr:MAG: CDP-diacylglycerol--glycerol-3-phosphate 3-phosphatidyltransferase [Zetaproteobacteria bacterium CG2_30_46_52]
MNWTLSNRITALRIVFVPLFVIAFFLPEPVSYYSTAIIFAIAGWSDWFDGYLARTRNEVTSFGRFLDPVADKLLVTTALILLVQGGYANVVLVVIIVSREVIVSALREWMAERNVIVHVSQMGKWKTVVQMCAIEGLLIHVDVYGFPMHEAGTVLLWLATALSVWSGYEYIRGAIPEFKKG